jgi:16S rRNA (guanine527-N7)-methyltransferase
MEHTADELATPSVSTAAHQLFGDQLPLAARYADILRTRAVEQGLLGPAEADVVWDRHILNCAVVTDLIPAGAEVCDVGSGAGLPGIVLAIRRPDLRVTCLEPLQRRATFLDDVVGDLDLAHVTVQRARAQEMSARTFDVVTSRAVAPLRRLVPMTWPLARPGGWLLALKGAKAAEEMDEARVALAELGAAEACLVVLGEGSLSSPVRVVQVRVPAGASDTTAATRGAEAETRSASGSSAAAGKSAGRRARRRAAAREETPS